jgi:hypothetical protein
MIGKAHGTVGMRGIVSSIEWMQFELVTIVKVSNDLSHINDTINIITRFQLMCIDSCTFQTQRDKLVIGLMRPPTPLGMASYVKYCLFSAESHF